MKNISQKPEALNLIFSATPAALRRRWLPELAEQIATILRLSGISLSPPFVLTRRLDDEPAKRTRSADGIIQIYLALRWPSSVKGRAESLRALFQPNKELDIRVAGSNDADHTPVRVAKDMKALLGEDLCLDFRTPLPLPVALPELTGSRFVELIGARYRELFGVSARLSPADNTSLLTHYADWVPATCHPNRRRIGPSSVPGYGANGHLLGAVFLRGADSSLIGALQAIAPYGLVPPGRKPASNGEDSIAYAGSMGAGLTERCFIVAGY